MLKTNFLQQANPRGACTLFFYLSNIFLRLLPLFFPQPSWRPRPCPQDKTLHPQGVSGAWQAQGVGAAAYEGVEPLKQSVKFLPVPYGVWRDWCLPRGSGFSVITAARCTECLLLEDCGFRFVLFCLNTSEQCSRLSFKSVRPRRCVS